ncbi:hypothetical protein LCGC14_0554770 [marine sediment metagenome]|uniref:Uncharacterized protein n=1 Tax=marine sediment metagenome TaxID=412755 RepID=A0A0F9S797_9ZZZZ
MVEQESYTCPGCGMTSYSLADVREQYCGNCHMTRMDVEAKGKMPRIISAAEMIADDPHEGPALVTEDRAMREGGKLDAADYSIMASAAHGEGAVTMSRGEILELAEQGIKVFGHLQDLARRRMKKRQARYVRYLRLDGHSWRSIAQLCYNRGWDWVSWAPPSNQIAGMVLCERAAELYGENYRREPWN